MKKTKKTSYLKKTGRKTLKRKKPKIVKTNYKIKRKLINVNGYNVLLLDLPKANLVQVECYILGSCLVEDKPGISHLLEHILTSAWKKCKPKTCDVFWEKYGAYSNATTHNFYKRYWINGLHKYLETMLEYIFSIMLDPVIDNKTLKTERPAVENELTTYLNNPVSKLDKELYKELYKISNLIYSGDWKKQLKVLKTITLKEVQEMYHRMYNKHNMLFVISGNIGHLEDFDFIKKEKIGKFQKEIEKKGLIIVKDRYNNCFNNGKKVVFVKDENAKNTTINIVFHLDIFPGNKDYYYFKIIRDVMTGAIHSLLLKELREKLKLVYSIKMRSYLTLCGTINTIIVSTLDKNVDKVLKNIFKIIKKYKKKNVSREKLLYIKNKYLMRLIRKHPESNPAMVSKHYSVQYLLQLNKKRKTILDINQEIKLYENLTIAKIKKYIKLVFNLDNCIIGYHSKKEAKFNISNF